METERGRLEKIGGGRSGRIAALAEEEDQRAVIMVVDESFTLGWNRSTPEIVVISYVFSVSASDGAVLGGPVPPCVNNTRG